MKKVYIKPELELIDLTAKELLLNGDVPDPILNNPFAPGIWGDETDVSLPDGWL